MLVAAAVCPHPPLLIPELAAGAAAELDELRAACDAAVSALAATEPDLLVVVGAADVDGPWPATAWGTMAGFGVDVTVGSPDGRPPSLPLALTIGRWLLGRQQPAVSPYLLYGVRPDTEPARCRQLGAGLADRAPRVGILAMGDGSARRSPKGPGYLDERAEPFDAAVAGALSAGSSTELLELDPHLAEELLVGGRAPWQVLAGAGEQQEWSGRVEYAEAPYGVTYLVATWTPA